MLIKKAARQFVVLASLAVVISGCMLAETGHTQQPDTPAVIEVRVTSVIDGDTIRATVNGRREHIRLIGVNAPEIGRNPQAGGMKARDFAREHLNRKTVWLELDARERDRHRRLLAYVWLQKPISASEAEVREHLFNARLLLEGHAQVMTVPPNVKYADMFVAFQREARGRR
jgi:micrococcal nuclease